MALSEYRGRPWFLVNYRTVIWSGEKNKIKKKKKKNKKKKTSTNLFDRAYGMRDKLFCATFSFALIIFFPLNLRCHFVISIYQYSRNFSSKFSSDFIASIHVSISQHLFLPFAQRREFWNRTSFGATLTLKPYFQPVMTARQAIFNLEDFEIRNALRTVSPTFSQIQTLKKMFTFDRAKIRQNILNVRLFIHILIGIEPIALSIIRLP